MVGIIALLVLGPKRLPEVGRSLGKGMREFKDSLSGKDDEPKQAELPHVTTTAPQPDHEPVAASQTPEQDPNA